MCSDEEIGADRRQQRARNGAQSDEGLLHQRSGTEFQLARERCEAGLLLHQIATRCVRLVELLL